MKQHLGFLQAVEILGPIRAYYDKGGTLLRHPGRAFARVEPRAEALGWCLDGRPAMKEGIIQAAEQWIKLGGPSWRQR